MVYWYGLCWRFDREFYNLLYDVVVNGLLDDDCVLRFGKWVVYYFGMIVFYFVGCDFEGNLRKDLWLLSEGIF